MTQWRPYHEVFPAPADGVSGEAWVWQGVRSAEIPSPRDVVVHLPPGHGEGRVFPTIYAMDGQSLFADRRAYSVGWSLDQRLAELAADGIDVVLVAVDSNADRDREYVPYAEESRADMFVRLLADTVVPAVDQRFPVSAAPADRFVLGSSFGALISLYALMERPDVFGGAGLMSPSLWPVGGAVFADLASRDPNDARVYVDVGTRESSGRLSALELHRRSRRYVREVRRLLPLVESRFRSTRYDEIAGARHHEADWSARFPAAVRFLLERDRA